VVANLMPFEPVVDGEVLPGPPPQRIAAGSGAGVALLVGTNRHEARLLFGPTGVLDRTTDAALAAVAAGYRLPASGLDAYRAALPDAPPGLVLSELVTDWFYRIPALRLAEAVPGTRVYEFGWESPVDALGSCHALEVPFVFDSLDDPTAAWLVGPAAPRALAAAMHGAWVAFATTGDPGWPPYDTQSRLIMRFDNRCEVMARP
jgi:para-nitrobenzyl esterase